MSNAGYNITSIAKAVKGEFLQLKNDNYIKHLSLDSRKLNDPSNTLFFAIKGPRHDGHAYLESAYETGVRNFVVSDNRRLHQLKEANILLVKDSTKALQLLVRFHRQQFNIPIIGITGSNGKTIVKEWLNQLLSPDKNIVRSPKSYNSQVGVPLSVWAMNEQHELGIFEAGISQPDEMDSLEKVIIPTIGVFTNIGDAHAEGFLNTRHKVKEKLKLFVHSDILIYCRDYPDINQSISEFKLYSQGDSDQFQLFTWSRKTSADLRVIKEEIKNKETLVVAQYKELELEIVIPFTDDASIENAISCWAVLLYMGISNSVIAERILSLGKVAMRLELKNAIHNCSLINDSYNSDLGSLNIALDFLGQQNQHTKKTVILSDILQSGKPDTTLYGQIKTELLNRKVDRLIGIGPHLIRQRKLFENTPSLEVYFFENTDQFIRQLSILSFQNEAILLKGARAFAFERISQLLEQKAHETVLEIDLNAVSNNFHAYKKKLKPKTKVCCMVKAFSYGSGSFEIANVLQYDHVDYLSVAYADEGVALRRAGITLPIMVMNPEESSFSAILSYQLEPEIYSFRLLHAFQQALLDNSYSTPFPVHLKLDTGMFRLGFVTTDIPKLIAELKDNSLFEIRSVYSHLASSEDGAHDEFTKRQIREFDSASQQIIDTFSYPILRHIANSAAIVRFPDSHFDMVRLGLGLYGIDITKRISLETVGTLKTVISQIKTVPKGESVGYSRSFIAETDTRVATVGVGYADGIDKRLGNGNGYMLINGNKAPIIGNVCMDMCMLDISTLDSVEEGHEVIVFGKELPVTTIAKQCGTISYEILTGISGRVKRVYYQE